MKLEQESIGARGTGHLQMCVLGKMTQQQRQKPGNKSPARALPARRSQQQRHTALTMIAKQGQLHAPVTRPTGASRSSKASSITTAQISLPMPQLLRLCCVRCVSHVC